MATIIQDLPRPHAFIGFHPSEIIKAFQSKGTLIQNEEKNSVSKLQPAESLIHHFQAV